MKRYRHKSSGLVVRQIMPFDHPFFNAVGKYQFVVEQVPDTPSGLFEELRPGDGYPLPLTQEFLAEHYEELK